MKFVMHPPVEEGRLAKIRRVAGKEVQVVNAPDESVAVREIEDAEGFFGKLTPSLLAAAKRLRWVQAPTVSLEHYVFPQLVDHPCTLTNMRGLFSDVIADQVMGYVICFARNLHTYIRQQGERRWAPVGGEGDRVSFATGPGEVNDIDRTHRHLGDCTMGIVGLGAIGRELAQRALAFEMTVIGVDPQVTAHEAPVGMTRVAAPEELGWLLGESDFVVIAAPHTPETESLFDRSLLQHMKTTGYLINIGRGAIVNLADLNAALDAGELAGAALDVFETEPLPANHSLWRQPNVILTPHVAGYSQRIAERHLAVLLGNLQRFRDHEPLINIADKSKWY